jgi:hypothetical protein
MSQLDGLLSEVPFRLFDFTAPDPQLQEAGIEPGFYYDIPLPPEERSTPNEVFLRGPFVSAEKARSAAVTFIQDALADHDKEDA